MQPDPGWLDPSCPWGALRSYGLPNLDWCEPSRCAWIAEPSNTWSNLAYIIGAFLIWRALTPETPGKLRKFAPFLAFEGAGSFLYHMSCTFAFQVLDFVGMFVFVGWLLALNLERARVVGAVGRDRAWVAMIGGGTAVLLLLRWLGLPYQPIIMLFVGGILVTEVLARLRGEAAPWAGFAVTAALFGAGGAFSWLDHTRTWCEPGNAVLHGHAIWHVLTGAGCYAAFLYYRSLEAAKAVRNSGTNAANVG